MEYSTIEELVKELAPVTGEPPKVYGAVVSRIDQDGRVWVNVAGSNIETPTATTSAEVRPNDAVNVEWRNNKLYIAGNVTNPSAGSIRVNAVEQAAQVANQAAQNAVADANVARQAAESAQAAVAEIEDDVTGLNARLTTAEGNITTIEGNITTLGGRVTTAEGKITTIEGDITDIESDVSGLSTRVGTAEGKVTTLEGNVTNLQGRVSDAESDISAVESDITSLQGRVDDAEETVDGTLRELSVAQDVIGTVNWIANHGTMTNQTGHQFDANQVYFIVDPNGDYNVGGTRYSVVSEPVASDINNYYLLTISDSVQNYVATHVVVDSEGLWIIPDAGGNKVLIATGNGTTYTTAGTYIVSGSNILAQFTANGAVIGKATDAHTTIDEDGMQIYSIDNSDNLVELANIGYGQGQGATGTEVAPYYTFGRRRNNSTIGNYSVAESFFVTASGAYSHAEGDGTTASGHSSHAEGDSTTASGIGSHAEGAHTTASGNDSHAEGWQTTASDAQSHAEGYMTMASNTASHAEGQWTLAEGVWSHAEGYYTQASGETSHSQNAGTIAQRKSQTALGEYNIADTTGTTTTRGDYAVIVGNGTDNNSRSNALTVAWTGDVVASGDITDGSGNVLSDKADASNLATVATSGAYSDLSGTPNLATVATSGSYNDLSNKPTIPVVPTNVSAFTNDAGYITGYTETDPTVPSWAKASTKPSYTASEIGNLADYVVEQGTSGIWTYRKWNSGIAECWGLSTFKTAISTTVGSSYRSSSTKAETLPFTFVDANYVVTGQPQSGLMHSLYIAGKQTTTFTWYAVHYTSSNTSSDRLACFHIVGRWQ